MKKLVMMLALVAAVVSAKAACVDWSVTATASDVGATVYLLTSMDDYADADALAAAAISSSSVASAGRGKYTTTKKTANDAAVTSTANFYYAIVDGNSYTYIAANDLRGKVYDPNSEEASKGTFDSISLAQIAAGTSKTFGGGGDVPEPTSGLLLLVGGAMLALRRRRA